MASLSCSLRAANCQPATVSRRLTQAPIRPAAGRPVTAKASLSTALFDLADGAQAAATQAASQAGQVAANPGSVDAPVWVIVASALVVTVALSASSFLLKPGVDAAAEVQKRDAGRWGPGKK